MHPKITITALVAGGLLLALLILRSGGPGAHGHEHGEAAEAPHGAAPAPASAANASASAPVAAPRTRFSDEQLRHNGILLADAGPARIAGSLPLLGEIQLDPDRHVAVTPRLAGRVEAVRVSAGDHVQRGQVLAVISSPALADSRADLLAARKRLALARTTHEREQRLWEEKISAEQDVLTARAALQEAEIAVEAAQQKLAALGASAGDTAQGLTRLEIRSPLSGVVVDRRASAGGVLKEDETLFEVADLTQVCIDVAVPAHELGQLREGMAARVRTSAFDHEGQARLRTISALIGTQNRQATARLVMPNPRGLWRPGLAVQVELQAEAAEVPVAVPVDALQTLDEARVVFVRQGPTFEARRVEIGRSDGRLVEIVQGLKPGERYAARNSFIVKADLGKAAAEHAH
ncbi:MAG: efflux RND transporter periplasmic adaptor subunit [Burkholderiales bacterium]|nr:MAG: efflux RND transporter periplasmic adaptor subunit [Burkholderiales bacterium]